MIKRLIFILITLTCTLSYANNKTVYYEPSITKLSGIITIKVSPGPPNYESIKKGDAAETGYYLVLDQPVDVDLLPNVRILENDTDEPTKNIKVMQLVIMHNSDWPKIKENHRVTLTGTLFYWLTGHHHTKVLMSVNTAQLGRVIN